MYSASTLTPTVEGGFRYEIHGPNETVTRCYSCEAKKVIESKIRKTLKRLNEDFQKAKGNYKAFTMPGKSQPIP